MSDTQPKKRTPASQRRKRKHLKVELPALATLDRRCRATQIVFERRSQLIEDLGGPSQLSTAKRALIDKASVLDVYLEAASSRWLSGEPLDISAYATLCNTLNRTLGLLGLERVARNVTPSFDQLMYESAAA